MGLLDRGPHVVTVQNRTLQQTAHGTGLIDDGEPVAVRGSLQPLSAAESAQFDGTIALTQKRFICRTWPGDANSVVTDADGNLYDCVGDPQHFAMSPATDHFEVVLKRRA
jgi:hypothetical protein